MPNTWDNLPGAEGPGDGAPYVDPNMDFLPGEGTRRYGDEPWAPYADSPWGQPGHAANQQAQAAYQAELDGDPRFAHLEAQLMQNWQAEQAALGNVLDAPSVAQAQQQAAIAQLSQAQIGATSGSGARAGVGMMNAQGQQAQVGADVINAAGQARVGEDQNKLAMMQGLAERRNQYLMQKEDQYNKSIGAETSQAVQDANEGAAKKGAQNAANQASQDQAVGTGISTALSFAALASDENLKTDVKKLTIGHEVDRASGIADEKTSLAQKRKNEEKEKMKAFLAGAGSLAEGVGQAASRRADYTPKDNKVRSIGTTYTDRVVSDERTKSNAESISNIGGYSFKYNDAARKAMPGTGGEERIGVLAQDVERSNPDLVEDVGGLKTIVPDKAIGKGLASHAEVARATMSLEEKLRMLEELIGVQNGRV